MDRSKTFRAAVCISGEPRRYEDTYKSVKRYFANLEPQWECDIFIHSWNSTSTPRNYQDPKYAEGHVDKYEQIYDIVELRDDLIKKYKPKGILVESKEVLRDLADYYGIKCSADQIISSNFLAMSQHISAERAANLKMGEDIILPSEDIIREPSLNNYDIVIKTRFDVMFFPDRCQLIDLHSRISRFSEDEFHDRTPTVILLASLVTFGAVISSLI